MLEVPQANEPGTRKGGDTVWYPHLLRSLKLCEVAVPKACFPRYYLTYQALSRPFTQVTL